MKPGCDNGLPGGCGDCVRCKNREYARAWRVRNKDKDAERKRQWVLKNPDKRKQAAREFSKRERQDNPEKVRERVRDSLARSRAANPELFRERDRKRYREQPEKRRKDADARRAYRYRLSPVQFRQMFNLQSGRCAMSDCRVAFGETRETKPQVDHCHMSGRIRGLLCVKCNLKLGQYETTLLRREAFENYLRSTLVACN